MTERSVTLYGRIFLRADIEMVTGLHIGGAAGGLEIGGVDKPVIRNARNNQPYIPGSSLKGKLRSLMEKAQSAPQNYEINRTNGVNVHVPETREQYENLKIGSVFGTLPERKGFRVSSPTRLAVRDIPLDAKSEEELKRMRTDLPYTEIKWEAAIDRVTSAAAPRQIERVPAGAVFGPAELVFSVYVGNDETPAAVAGLFETVIDALGHLEDDYLGGMGSRGNGQVRLRDIVISARKINGQEYTAATPFGEKADHLADINREELRAWLASTFA